MYVERWNYDLHLARPRSTNVPIPSPPAQRHQTLSGPGIRAYPNTQPTGVGSHLSLAVPQPHQPPPPISPDQPLILSSRISGCGGRADSGLGRSAPAAVTGNSGRSAPRAPAGRGGPARLGAGGRLARARARIPKQEQASTPPHVAGYETHQTTGTSAAS